MATYTFTLDVEVHDETALFRLAEQQTRKEGLENQYELMDRETYKINVETCLQVLLDPGVLLGCSIEESSVEEISP